MPVTRGGPDELRRWILRMTKDAIPGAAGQLHQKIHIQLADGVIADTPVGNPDLWKNPPPPGYAGGRARGNWQSSIGAAASGETGVIDPSGAATQQKNRSVALSIRRAVRSFIANNVPYIERLNNAPQWSKQQKPHWVERNIQRVRAQFGK